MSRALSRDPRLKRHPRAKPGLRGWLLALGTVLAVTWCAWSVLRTPRYANLPPSARGAWVAFGDSLTEGHGASEGHDYPSLLGRSLGIPIVNMGRSGETSADGLKRAPELLKLQPRVVLLCFGGNDTLDRSSRERMYGNIAAIIDLFLKEGSFVVLIGIRSATLRDQNEKGFRQLAKEKNVFYVPNILKGIFPKPVYMSDAVHPNDEGYRLIADRLGKELRRLVRNPRLGLLPEGN